MDRSHDIRWKQRFDNFDRAFVLLREVCEWKIDSLSRLEKEGAPAIRGRLRAGLEDHQGLPGGGRRGGATRDARNVIKEAFAARLLDDAQVWIDMMLHRNLLSHTYDIKVFEEVLQAVAERYFPALDHLHEFFMMKCLET